MQPVQPRRPRVLIITGPTGVGKTEVSLQLAHELNGEVISADSVQVYRQLDIGSAKLPEDERQGVRHHLIDVVNFDTEYTAADFHDDARIATANILARGKLPIVVGGSSFYLRMYMFGIVRGGKPSQAVVDRAAQLLGEAKEAAAAAHGCSVEELPLEVAWKAGVGVLRGLEDGDAADRVEKEFNNWYRLERAVQVVLSTGAPMAESAMRLDAALEDLDYDFRPFLLTRPRRECFRRIDKRVEDMILGGLLDEAHHLLACGHRAGSNMATSAIGYRQTLKWLQELDADGDVQDDHIRALATSIQGPSRRLMGAQLKFHRQLRMFQRVDVSGGVEATVNAVLAEVQKDRHAGDTDPPQYLSKEEQSAMKRYTTKFTQLQAPEALESIRQWLRAHGYIRGATRTTPAS